MPPEGGPAAGNPPAPACRNLSAGGKQAGGGKPPALRRVPLAAVSVFLFALLGLAVHLWQARALLGGPRSRGLPRGQARVAFFIQVSGGNHGTLPQLLRALCDGPGNADFAVHFDAAMDGAAVSSAHSRAARALRAAGCAPADLTLVPRERVTYRGVTLTHNILSGAAHLLRTARIFDFLVNLSAADYPLARPALARALLARAASRRLSFLSWAGRGSWAGFAARRFGWAHVDPAVVGGAGTHAAAGGPNPLAGAAEGFVVAKSSSWFILSRELAEHLVLGARPRRLLAAFALADTPDEHFFATVVHGDAYLRARAVPASMRAIFWVAPNGTRARQHPYYVDEVGARGVPVFWDALRRRPAFYTRKIRNPGGPLVDRIDRQMLGRAPAASAADRREQRRFEKRLAESFAALVARHLAKYPTVRPQPRFVSAFRDRTPARGSRKRRLPWL